MDTTGVTPPAARRWIVLVAGLLATIAGSAFSFGLPYLMPALRAEGMTITQAATLVAAPTAGLLFTLIAWGAAADRWGERVVLVLGLGLATAALAASAVIRDPVLLGVAFLVAGAGGASVHAASGRLILGWFPAAQRGLAMGIRQTAQPLGVGVAALTLPALAGHGRSGALWFLAAQCLVGALLVLVLVRDPARPTGAAARTGSPYRTPLLWRIHGASALLVVPQFAVATYALVFLVDQRHWDPTAAGRLLALAQVGGAVSRLVAGYWSDLVGSRTGPMRVLAVVIGAVMALLAVGAFAGSGYAVPALVLAVVVSVSTNGLAFTAVAEHAGSAWAGRALGVQNTAQNVFASATPPVLAGVITLGGYGTAFAAVVAFPLLAGLVVPYTRRPA